MDEKFLSMQRLLTILSTPAGIIGATIVVIFLAVAILSPVITPRPPQRQYPEIRLMPPGGTDAEGNVYWLGTDNLGRDMLSRIIYGTRVSAIVGISTVIVACTLGMSVGLIAGYMGGKTDAVLMRIVDTFMAFPPLLLALSIAGVAGASGLGVIIVVLGITRWVVFARVVRAEVLSLRGREFVEAARALGQSRIIIMFRHILPNIIPSAIVLGTLSMADAIIAEASLSFLGVGVQPPAISWGQLLAVGRTYVATAWWLATFPGLAITIVVLGVMLIGDRLRDVLDPRMKQ